MIEPVTRRGRTRRVVLASLTVSHAVDDLYQSAVPALLPFLVAQRRYSYAAAAGLILAATFLSSVVQPVFGILTDRYRWSWLIPVGMGIAGTGVGLSGVVGGYPLTWLVIALSGLGVAAYHPEASRAVHAARQGSATGMSWFALGGNVGLALGPVLTTAVVGAGGLAATPLLALPALTAAPCMAASLRGAGPTRAKGGAAPGAQVPVRARGSLSTGPPESSGAGERIAPARPANDWRAFRRLTALVVLRSILYHGVAAFLGLYLAQRFDGSTSGANAGLVIMLTVGAVGTVLGGWMADRVGRVVTVRCGYALTVPGLAAVLLAPNAVAARLGCALLGLALYIPFSVHVTLGQEYLPRRVGTASGITLGLAVSVGGVLAPALGLAADHLGLRRSLSTLLVLPVVALLVSARLPDPRPRSTTAARPAPSRAAAGGPAPGAPGAPGVPRRPRRDLGARRPSPPAG